MKPGQIIAIVIGGLLALPAFALLAGGTALGVAHVVERNDDGYFDVTLDRLNTPTAAITTGEVDLRADPGPPDWLLEFVDFSVRIRATGVGERSSDIFVGIGAEEDVDAYLQGVARDEIRDVRGDHDIRYRTFPGTVLPAPPASQTFWVVSASGGGTQEIVWDFEEGTWAAVLMNADGSPGVTAEATVAIRSGALLPVGLGMLAVGVVLLVIAVAIIVLAARSQATEAAATVEGEEPGEAPTEAAVAAPSTPQPVRLEAEIDAPLSQWLWLVKWFLVIPHVIVLFFLGIAYLVLTVVAGFAILFTGRYPRGMFEFNVGVLRWGWRVLYYAASGGLGTDRYPPFTTDPVDDYPARLDIAYPEQLSRGLVLVKWWLLAIPHYLVVGIIAGWSWQYGWPGGLLGLLVLIAAVILLFTGRYPRPLFDLIIGLNRWIYRLAAYVSLMTDEYPPFRLDQGGREPVMAGKPSPETGTEP